MAIAFQPEWTLSERVAEAVMGVYAMLGHTAQLTTVGSLIEVTSDLSVGGLLCAAVAELRAVEVVLEQLVNPGALRQELDRLVSQDWAVVVLVHSAAIGEAHRELRGTSCYLQAWWEQNGEIVFGGHETP